MAALAGFGLIIFVFIYFLNLKPLNQSKTLIDALRSQAQGGSTEDVFNKFKEEYFKMVTNITSSLSRNLFGDYF